MSLSITLAAIHFNGTIEIDDDLLRVDSDYTYARHVTWMQAAIVDDLDLHDATFFGQDWGVCLRLVAENPDRFARVIIGNTGLPTGKHAPSDAFIAW